MAKKQKKTAEGAAIPTGSYLHKSGQVIPTNKSINKAGELVDKKVVNKRSIEDLKKMGPKGALIVATQRGFALASANTNWVPSKDEAGNTMKDKEGKVILEASGGVLDGYSQKSINGVVHQLTAPAGSKSLPSGGKIINLSTAPNEDGSATSYDKVIAAAKAAKPSIVANEWNQDVADFISALLALTGSGGGGGKRSGAILADFDF